MGVGTPLEAIFARYAYSDNGQRISVTDANNNLTSYAYDGFDRLVKLSFPVVTPRGGLASSISDYEEYGYDPNSNRTSLRKRSGATIAYNYDLLNRLESKILPSPDAGSSVYNEYDAADRLTFSHLGSAGGAGVGYHYDSAGRLDQETSFGRTVYSDHDKAGNRIRVTWPDNFYVDYVYDAANRLKEVRENGATSGAGLLASLTYGPLDQRSTLTRGNTTAASYTYDPIGRLSGLTQGALPSTASSIQTLAYNPASQLAHLTQASNAYVWTGHPTTEKNSVHDGLNRDSSIAAIAGGFDLNGNLAKDGTRTFTYDVMNRMTSETGGAAPLSLTYDPGDRIFQTTSGSLVTQFLYDGDRLIAEYNGSSSTPLRRYVHGAGVDEPLVWYEGSGPSDKRWLHADRQGSIVAWSDSSTTHLYTYGPYGEPQDWQGSRFRYTGQIALPEAQLYHYKARVYDPVMGRFLQTDPIGQEDDPNLYAYVKGDPENNSDPTGTILDTIADIAFIALDVADIAQNGASLERGLALGADVIGAAVPFATGGGLAVRAAFKGAEQLEHANQANRVAQGASGGERAGKAFTRAGKSEVRNENASRHAGQTTCEKCGTHTSPAQQSQKGVTPPKNETHVDHIIPKSKGGDGAPNNGQVLCRECNLDKSNK